jgi:hypothetical protein
MSYSSVSGLTSKALWCSLVYMITYFKEMHITGIDGMHTSTIVQYDVCSTSFNSMYTSYRRCAVCMHNAQMLAGEQREQQEVVTATQPIDANYMAQLREKVATGMRVSVYY